MATINNPWLNSLQRSYQQIKRALLAQMNIKLPEVTDKAEGNIFVILISIFASIAEVIHYYIDNMGRETFFTTARRYSSLVKHAKLLDYHIKSAIPASGDVLVSLSDSKVSPSDYNIPAGTEFQASNGLLYRSVKNKVLYAGTYGVYVPIQQKNTMGPFNIGNIMAETSLIYIDETNGLYVEGSALLRLDNKLWTLVETFGLSKPDDTHYIIMHDEDQRPYIKFGDGQFGAYPPINATISLTYDITKGSQGNDEPGTIIGINMSIPDVVVNNTTPLSGGSNYENFNMLKDHVPLSIRTLGVAISKQDYEDVAKLAPGVEKTYVNYRCGKFVDIYITPDGGGVASESLLDTTYAYMSSKKLITTNIRILPTGSSLIYLALSVTGKPSVKTNSITDAVNKALIDKYSYSNSEVGRTVRLSDIYATLDNLDVVEYLKIENIYTQPYPIMGDGVTTNLNIGSFKIISVLDTIDFTIQFKGGNTIEVTSDMGDIFEIVMGMPYTVRTQEDIAIFEILINNPEAGLYTLGDTWKITLIPKGIDQAIQDFSIPRMTLDTISLSVIETQ